jgi:hypothetical protein
MSDGPAQPTSWLIESGRVGDLRLGAPVPATLVTAALADGYHAGFVADGQAEDRFTLLDPPVTIVIDGPFAARDRDGRSSGPPSAAVLPGLRQEALAAVKAGAPVVAIRIDGPGPVTASGAGVGSTLAALEAIDPALVIVDVPPTLGAGGDRAVARGPSLPGVAFVFASRELARAGATVTRIDLWPTR